jgi:hypothetical protein
MSRTGGAAFQADAAIVNGTNGNESIPVAGEAFAASASRSAGRGRTPSPGKAVGSRAMLSLAPRRPR